MTLYFCDLCGKKEHLNNLKQIFGVKDVCPNCLKQIEAFVESMKKRNQ